MIDIIINSKENLLKINGRGIDKECRIRDPIQLMNTLDELFELITDGHDPVGVTLYLVNEAGKSLISSY